MVKYLDNSTGKSKNKQEAIQRNYGEFCMSASGLNNADHFVDVNKMVAAYNHCYT